MEELSETLSEMLGPIAAAAIVVWGALRIADRYLETRNRETVAGLRAQRGRETLTVRLQAFERLLLLLERSEPSNLILRIHRPGMGAAQFRAELLNALRTEYEHNLTQQLYVSTASWQKVQEAREAVIQIVNAASSKMTDSSTGLDLSTAMLAIVERAGLSPTQQAVDALKREAQELL